MPCLCLLLSAPPPSCTVNLARQLSKVNTRRQRFSLLDPFPASANRHQSCSLLPLNSWQLNGHTGGKSLVLFLARPYLPRTTEQNKIEWKQQVNPLHLGGKLHATIASSNSPVKQRRLPQMLKALRAEASVTSSASGCQRWLKTWEQASVIKIPCVGVWVRAYRSGKSDIWGALYRSWQLLGILCIT